MHRAPPLLLDSRCTQRIHPSVHVDTPKAHRTEGPVRDQRSGRPCRFAVSLSMSMFLSRGASADAQDPRVGPRGWALPPSPESLARVATLVDGVGQDACRLPGPGAHTHATAPILLSHASGRALQAGQLMRVAQQLLGQDAPVDLALRCVPHRESWPLVRGDRSSSRSLG